MEPLRMHYWIDRSFGHASIMSGTLVRKDKYGFIVRPNPGVERFADAVYDTRAAAQEAARAEIKREIRALQQRLAAV